MIRASIFALACTTLAACAPTPGERVARDVSIIASERKPDTLLARGLAFAEVGDLTRAEQYLVAALDAGTPADLVLPKLLVICIASSHYRAGIEYAAPELQRNPDNASLRFVVAELEALTGDVTAARGDFDTVDGSAARRAGPAFRLRSPPSRRPRRQGGGGPRVPRVPEPRAARRARQGSARLTPHRRPRRVTPRHPALAPSP